MKKEILDILEIPFAPEMIKQREGNYGQTLDYIEGWSVIERLNQAFEADWSFEIALHEILEDAVVVLGKLSAGGVVKSQFGSSSITRAKESGKPTSIGDDLKAAGTDALKKCASLLGVGLHLYNGDNRTDRERNEQFNQIPSEQTTNAGVQEPDAANDGGQTSKDTRLTSKQLSYIHRLARDRRMTDRELRQKTMEAYKVQPEYLTKAQASETIDQFLAN
jgi:recombination DNA repair RAD52 pathway protein